MMEEVIAVSCQEAEGWSSNCTSKWWAHRGAVQGGGADPEHNRAPSLPAWIGPTPEYVYLFTCSAVHPTDIFDSVLLFQSNDVIA